MTNPRDANRVRNDAAGASLGRATGVCRDDERAQSEVLGVVLLLGIAIIGIGVAFTLGFSAFDEGKDSADVGQAEQSFSQLDKEASAVALGDARVRDVDLGFRANAGQVRTEPSSGWINVSIINDSDGSVDWSTQASLGAVVYENGRTTVAYQGGGVWRSDGSGSVMVSEPEVHYRGGTLTVPVVSIRGEPGIDSRVQVTPAGSTDRRFPDPENNQTNRIKTGKVEVTVQSEYYEAWGQYFEDSTNAYVYYNDSRQEVTAVFLAIPRYGTLDDGIIATSGTGELKLVGKGAYVDSYNSLNGSYLQTKSGDGKVRAVGDILTKSTSTIRGDVYSGADVTARDDSKIDGNAFYTNELVIQNDAKVTGINDTISGVPSILPIDGFVESNVDQIRQNNMNSQESNISNNEIDISGSKAVIGAGSYYLENLELNGEKLILDTSDGNISIAVEDWITLKKGANLTVRGQGNVQFYVESQTKKSVSLTGNKMDVNLAVGKDSAVFVKNQSSPKFRIYGPQNFVAGIGGSQGNNASFVGVMYAPAGKTGSGKVYIKQANYYGQILTGNLTLGQYGQVHYDRALEGMEFPQSPFVARLEFLHVAVHPVNVSDAAVRPVSLTGLERWSVVGSKRVGEPTASVAFEHSPRLQRVRARQVDAVVGR